MTDEEFEQLKTLLAKFFQANEAFSARCYCIGPTCNEPRCPMYWHFWLLSRDAESFKDLKWV